MSEPNVFLVLNSRDDVNNVVNNIPNYQTTNYASPGQNIVQGQLKKLSLNEINFPYDIPNVMSGYNTFTLINGPAPFIDLVITVPPGFYTGTELATEINAQIVLVSAAYSPPVALANQPICSFDTSSNRFSFSSPASPTAPRYSVWNFQSKFTFPENQSLLKLLGKDLLSIMGYYTQQLPLCNSTTPFVSGSAPLTFTQYIDVVSPQLCQFQNLQGGNSTNLSKRINIICRLYIANNTATTNGVEGTRPVVINRQYTNERMMNWTAGNSLGNLTLELYDDVGNPLKYEWLPRPFQITFNVYESEETVSSSTPHVSMRS